jgi:hypothetical protein
MEDIFISENSFFFESSHKQKLCVDYICISVQMNIFSDRIMSLRCLPNVPELKLFILASIS